MRDAAIKAFGDDADAMSAAEALLAKTLDLDVASKTEERAAQKAAGYQRFSQADDSISRRYGGTGLGLEISLGLARLMQGDITVISEPGLTLTVPPGTRVEVAGDAATSIERGTTRTVAGGASIKVVTDSSRMVMAFQLLPSRAASMAE